MNKLNGKNTNIKDDKNNTSDIYDRENISYDEQNFFDLSINKKNGIKDSKKNSNELENIINYYKISNYFNVKIFKCF